MYELRITILSFLILFFFADAPLLAQDEKPLVVSTASIFADMAQLIGGDEVRIESVVPIGGDPHTYEPTPSDAQLIASADLILKNGLTFEGWLSELIENSGTKADVKLITEGITPIGSQTYANSSDPHAWMDASNGLKYIENIKDALVKLRPELKEQFEFNYGVYRQQIEDMDTYIQTEINKIPAAQRVLITSHDAFQYYGRRYGLRLESVLGTSTDAQVQTSDMKRLVQVIKETGVPAVFVESTINPKLLEQLAEDNGVSIGGQLYSDSIGDKDSPAPSYLDMLKHNTNTIVKALSAKKKAAVTEHQEEDSTNWLLWGVLALLLIGGFVVVARQM
jgi:ABC-type Zn uptake system ZnuABC Zn-binding protein ZnuA